MSNHEQQSYADDGECPVCHVSFLSKRMSVTPLNREDHISACLNKASGFPSSSAPRSHGVANIFKLSESVDSSSGPSEMATLQRGTRRPIPDSRHPSGIKTFLSKLGIAPHPTEEKADGYWSLADEMMNKRWGPPGTEVRDLVARYWIATRMEAHWNYLRSNHHKQFQKLLSNGYMEPIPVQWIQDHRLASENAPFSKYENPAEERLYYLLNHGILPDGSKPSPILPLNANLHMHAIVRRGNARNARQVPLDPQLLAAYRSQADVFHGDRKIQSHQYSCQLPPTVYQARSAALHDLADGILHGTDHLETMLLIDVSGSMTWDPHKGVLGPDGVRRFHDQPANIRLVEHLVHRVLHHMIPRTRREHPGQAGIDTCIFSTDGLYIGQLTTETFQSDWLNGVHRNLGGGTQVMQGWQTVKQTYFQQQNERYGHGRYDEVFGWQPTSGMPKLSLLVFLDGEASDMDEFELELLGESWAYVTIALVGMENCPHHHSHALELERVAKFNPHVGFVDVHGRVCERWTVEELLGSVYPVDPPSYEEILRPEYDLRMEDDVLPSYRE